MKKPRDLGTRKWSNRRILGDDGKGSFGAESAGLVVVFQIVFELLENNLLVDRVLIGRARFGHVMLEDVDDEAVFVLVGLQAIRTFHWTSPRHQKQNNLRKL